jgi:hypothetical protein
VQVQEPFAHGILDGRKGRQAGTPGAPQRAIPYSELAQKYLGPIS